MDQEDTNQDPYILIIDEINRGNISRIFGELITLIEDSKAIPDADEELRVTLPYSKKELRVPQKIFLYYRYDELIRPALTGLRYRFTSSFYFH